MKCSNAGIAETRSIPGPGGAQAILKIASHDDYAKDTHDCMAEYTLILRIGKLAPVEVDLMRSDADWSRPLFGQVAGFSQDGKRLLGLIGEGGRIPFSDVFDVDVSSGRHKLTPVKGASRPSAEQKCGSSFRVAGTTANGLVVLKPGNPCDAGFLWEVEPRRGTLRLLGREEAVVPLLPTR